MTGQPGGLQSGRYPAGGAGEPEAQPVSGPPPGRDGASSAAAGKTHEAVQDAIRQRGFRILYQPIYDIASSRCLGFEALARFPDATPPELWFKAADDHGLGVELEVCAVRKALEIVRGLPDGMYVSVNVSPATLASDRLSDALKAFPHESVIVELTEQAEICDPDSLAEHASLLQFRGVRIAIDDFGVGRSRIRQILQLRPDYIKLHGSLVSGIATDFRKQALIDSITAFGMVTRTEIIAEGIESEPDLDTLRSLGVRFGQGWLLGRPVEIDKALAQWTLLRFAGIA